MCANTVLSIQSLFSREDAPYLSDKLDHISYTSGLSGSLFGVSEHLFPTSVHTLQAMPASLLLLKSSFPGEPGHGMVPSSLSRSLFKRHLLGGAYYTTSLPFSLYSLSLLACFSLQHSLPTGFYIFVYCLFPPDNMSPMSSGTDVSPVFRPSHVSIDSTSACDTLVSNRQKLSPRLCPWACAFLRHRCQTILMVT